MLYQLWSDLRYAVRSLIRAPGFTLVAAATLAIGIGANTAIFSVVNGVLLEPLPFDEPDELVGVYHTAPGLGYDQFDLSPDTYTLIRNENDVFSEMALFNSDTVNLTGVGDPLRVSALTTTRELADVLKLDFPLGRGFTLEEDRPGGPQVVILGYDLWQNRYGGDRNILGTSIDLDGTPREVVGVLPREFDVLNDAALWLPLAMDPDNPTTGSFGLDSIARLAPGRTADVAETLLAPLIDRLVESNEGADTYLAFIRTGQLGILVNPLKEAVVGDLTQPLWILLGTVGFVLLIACANVANLVLVRAESRQREIAVRAAVGAGRNDIFRHFMAESAVLAMLGGVGGIFLAWAGVPALLALTPDGLPRAGEIGIGAPVLAFTGGLVLLAMLVFGTAPALRFFGGNYQPALGSSRGTTAGRNRHRVRNLLVAGQAALALILLVGSGLMLRSFDQLQSLNPGFDPEGVLTFQVNLPREGYPSARAAADFNQELIDRLSGLPGVTSVSAANYAPLSGGGSGTAVQAEDIPLSPDELPPMLWYKYVAPDYFRTMRTRLIAGRSLDRADHQQALPNIVINKVVANRLWPGREQGALGKRLGRNDGDTVPFWFTVVGVAENVADEGLREEPRELIYYSMVSPQGDDGWVTRSMTYVVRTSGPPASLAGPARAEVWAMNRNLPIAEMQDMATIVADSTARLSFTMISLAIAAAVALLLGGIGLYGVLSYVVNQRTQEMGVRMALGAETGQVLWMVVRQGMMVVGTGLVMGVAASLYLGRVLESLLYGTAPNDPLTFVATSGVLLLVGFLASYVPARRASAINPMEALRAE